MPYYCAECGAELEDAGCYKHECPNGCIEALEIGQLLDFGYAIERTGNETP